MKQWFILLTIVLLTACNTSIKQTSTTFTHHINAKQTCSHLYPIRQPEDFVQQMYAHLDSDCLFQLSAEELEKIWQIPVVSSEVTFGITKELADKQQKMRKQTNYPYYIFLHPNKIRLAASDAFFKKNSTLLKKEKPYLHNTNAINITQFNQRNQIYFERRGIGIYFVDFIRSCSHNC